MEVSTTVDDIMGTPGTGNTADDAAQEYMLTVQQLANVAGEYARRIRLLTWAVVAIVIYLVLKEVN